MLREVEVFQSIKSLLMEIYASAYKEFKIYFRYPLWFLADLVASPLWILMLLYPILLFLPYNEWNNPKTYNFFYWGIVSWDLLSISFWGIGNLIRREQEMGTIEQSFLTNANRIALFVGRVFSEGFIFLIDAVYMVLIIHALFGVWIEIRSPFLLLISVFLALFLSVGFGALYGALVLYIKSPGAISNVLQFLFIGIGGAFFPVSRLPAQLRLFAYSIPFTYAIDLLRNASMDTETILPPVLEYLLAFILGVFLNVLGLSILLLIEKKSKRTGKLGLY